MTKPEIPLPVLIVGGGPVGLFMAISLLKNGIACKVIEKRKDRVPDSRSLGIHPVSLELFDELDITDKFLARGLKIKKGIALTEHQILGEISFENCPKPHNYILACPQFFTEEILREELFLLDETALITEAEFQGYRETADSVDTTFSTPKNSHQKIQSRFLIACDGKNSQVRQQASIHFSGKRYPDTYIMGDFEDTTHFGKDAAVYLSKTGLIECFPLPNGMRRWVAKTDSYESEATVEILTTLVKDRTRHDISGVNHTMMSSFGVQHLMAETFTKGRVILAGDAAHVVSPIGGQGMNLGWLDCKALVEILTSAKHNEFFDIPQHQLDSYTLNQQKIIRKAARRAEINMRLGRSSQVPFIKDTFVKLMLHSPLKNQVARLFTMRGLASWLI